MSTDYETWEDAIRVAIARAKHSARRYAVYSHYLPAAYWSAPASRRWFVREVSA